MYLSALATVIITYEVSDQSIVLDTTGSICDGHPELAVIVLSKQWIREEPIISANKMQHMNSAIDDKSICLSAEVTHRVLCC